MAIERNHRFPIDFSTAFPKGLLRTTDIEPLTEFVGPGKVGPQRVDEATGLRCWKVGVLDPSESKPKRASFELTFLSTHMPVPAASAVEVMPGVQVLVLEGVEAAPRVMGQGEFKYLGYSYFARGIAGDVNTPKTAPASPNTKGGNSTDASKAA